MWPTKNHRTKTIEKRGFKNDINAYESCFGECGVFLFFFVVSKIIFGSYEVTPSSLASFALHIVHHYLAVWKTLPGHDIWVSQWGKKKSKVFKSVFFKAPVFYHLLLWFWQAAISSKTKTQDSFDWHRETFCRSRSIPTGKHFFSSLLTPFKNECSLFTLFLFFFLWNPDIGSTSNLRSPREASVPTRDFCTLILKRAKRSLTRQTAWNLRRLSIWSERGRETNAPLTLRAKQPRSLSSPLKHKYLIVA